MNLGLPAMDMLLWQVSGTSDFLLKPAKKLMQLELW